uniref:Methyltransferase type 11 domain-containing protein n=1 Tax=Chlorobium chlorochromatii (strain CaD3) TaxID=340177 RepID=Q3AST6_CHLCH
MNKKIMNLPHKVNKKIDLIEFNKIKAIFRREFKRGTFKLLDVGSGLCSFPNYIKNEFENAKIYCIDINKDLVDLATKSGYNAQEGDLTKLNYNDNTFDVVHCSHVVEHLPYPHVIEAIDELVRVCKSNGLIIIRSPLWANHRFYNDIDHIRPYPPNSILNYFANQQQQKVSKHRIVEEDRWYTKIYYEINPLRFNYKIIKYINFFLKISWLFLSFPIDRPNNYGIVLRKRSGL